VAPNQCGTNPVSEVASYGHSMIVGPWGRKLAEANDVPGIIQATLDPTLLEQTRRRVPALQHRRLG
jgi:nitrilase